MPSSSTATLNWIQIGNRSDAGDPTLRVKIDEGREPVRGFAFIDPKFSYLSWGAPLVAWRRCELLSDRRAADFAWLAYQGLNFRLGHSGP
jgi:hypothetical protein